MANKRRRLIGRVVSDKMTKTVVVAIERRKMHPVYKKVIKLTKKVMAHDESNAVEVGSVVQLVESQPLSRNKRWVVEKVLEGPGGRIYEAVVTGDLSMTEIEVEPVAETEAEPMVEAVAEAEAEAGEAGEETAS